jgi:tRNA-binding EMAP/Myf-like protein
VADELVVGTVVAAAEHPGARAPSLLVTLDLGPHGTVEASLAGAFDADELEGTQLVCRRDDDGAVVVGAQSHGAGLVLLRPEREVEPGTLVS